jgi:adenylosuccinate lyase
MHLTNISPVDGRYQLITQPLSSYLSEQALIQYRIKIEIEYFIALSNHNDFAINLDSADKEYLRNLFQNFSAKDALEVKKIEQTTNHDVKAVEYWIKSKIELKSFADYSEFIHFALTSEDINNLSFTSMYKDAVQKVILPELNKILAILKELSKSTANQSMLSLTHGQSATPTTFGKEIAVFVARLQRQVSNLESIKFLGKFGGATGTWSAHQVAYPNFDWLGFAQTFVESFDLEFCPLTTQIVPADSLVESYDTLKRINTILIDFAQDIWLYVERGILSQVKKEGEVGSSAMPHKINPINFENAEGNLQWANSMFVELGRQLPVSRMQRDLTGSTVIRNQGIPLSHSLIAYQNLLKGLSRISVNETAMNFELESHPEVLAEAIQTYLRSQNYPNAYEVLKGLTRGEKVTLEGVKEFVNSLDINGSDKKRLLELTPSKYTGLSENLVIKYIK